MYYLCNLKRPPVLNRELSFHQFGSRKAVQTLQVGRPSERKAVTQRFQNFGRTYENAYFLQPSDNVQYTAAV